MAGLAPKHSHMHAKIMMLAPVACLVQGFADLLNHLFTCGTELFKLQDDVLIGRMRVASSLSAGASMCVFARAYICTSV
jgi:hypothetical protein